MDEGDSMESVCSMTSKHSKQSNGTSVIHAGSINQAALAKVYEAVTEAIGQSGVHHHIHDRVFPLSYVEI